MMVKKLLVFVMMLMLLASNGLTAASADTLPSQIVNAGGTVYYDAQGNVVAGATGVGGSDGAVVMVRKTVAPNVVNNQTIENEFVVTLEVQTSQDVTEIAGDTPDTALLMMFDVSNSMDDCVNCGLEASHQNHVGTTTPIYYCTDGSGNTFTPPLFGGRNCVHCGLRQSRHNEELNHTAGSCGYEARLAATKLAALDFLDEIINETGAQPGDKRWVAIGAFGTSAKTLQTWVDVTTTEGMHLAQEAIEHLQIANGDGSAQGGTSTESGLVLARNLLNSSAISDVEYRYTILLTDGQPTYGVGDVNSTGVDSVAGSTDGNGGSTELQDIDSVAAIAQSIKNTSKLYSICFGTDTSGTAVWELTPFKSWSGENPQWSTNSSTEVGEWLGSFSTAAYQASQATSSQLFDTFSNVLAQIQVAARAWKVEDWMGPYIGYRGVVDPHGRNSIKTDLSPEDYANGKAPAFQWNLLTSGNDPALTSWNNETKTGYLGYSHQYYVQLDNLDVGYQGGATPVNQSATLCYATTVNDQWPESVDDYETVNFPVPQVQGLYADLQFTKVDNLDNKLANVVFRLRHQPEDIHPSVGTQLDYLEVTSDANGVVTFHNIPSGHAYDLLEEEIPEWFVDPGDIPVDVSWGTATVEALNDNNELVNVYDPDNLGKLRIVKSFAQGSEIPHSIQFLIEGPNGFTSHRELGEVDKQTDGTWAWTLTGLYFGNYTIRETNAKDEHGNLLRNTHDLSYSIQVDDSATQGMVQFDGQNVPEAEFTLSENDPDKLVTVHFTNLLTDKQGTLSINKEFVALPDGLEDELIITVKVTPVDEHNVEIGNTFHEMILKESNGFADSLELPIGYYKLDEEVTGKPDGYTMLHNMWVNAQGAEISNQMVQVTDQTTAAVLLKNHYEQDKGHLHVAKVFAHDSDLSKDDFAARNLYVNVYDEEGTYVTTLDLDAFNNWNAPTGELPMGTYYLEEVTQSGAEGTAYTPGHTHTVSWSDGTVGPRTSVTLENDGQHVEIQVINKYEEIETQPLEASIYVKKILQQNIVTEADAADLQKTYTILVTPDAANTAAAISAPQTVDLQVTGKTATLTATQQLTFQFGQAGVYKYILTEDAQNVQPGELYSSAAHELVFEVLKNADTNQLYLASEPTPTQEANALTFENEIKQTALTYTKQWDDDSDQRGLRPDTITLALSYRHANGQWQAYDDVTFTPTNAAADTWTLEVTNLPLYIDNAQVEYGVTEKAVEGYRVSYSGETPLVNQGVITNTYYQASGSTNFAGTKQLNGRALTDGEFTFQVKKDGTLVGTATQNANGDIAFPTLEYTESDIGQTYTYTVTEVAGSERGMTYDDTEYTVTVTIADNNDGTLTVTPSNNARALNFTNTYVTPEKTVVKVPVSKTVKVTGNTVPGPMTFQFGIEVDNSRNVPIEVAFEDANGNLTGPMTNADAYSIALDAPGTASGCLVITGYADELDGLQLTTWEKLAPFSSIAEARANHWEYDKTAWMENCSWTVTLQQTGEDTVAVDVAMGSQRDSQAITFENQYTKKVEVPTTGDNSTPIAYLMMLTLAIGGMLVLRKKREAN